MKPHSRWDCSHTAGNLNLASASGMGMAWDPRLPSVLALSQGDLQNFPDSSPHFPEAELINFVQERKARRMSWQIMSLFLQKSLRLFMLFSFVLNHISIRIRLLHIIQWFSQS